MKVELADKYSCTGCMACVDVCPKQAISRIIADDGHCYVKINETLCVKCKKCENLCKSIHENYGSNDKSLSKPFAAWANKEEYRKGGTSGGVFAALAYAFIQKGGLVACASFDGFSAKHVLISETHDILALQGSKYVQSNTEGIFKEIEIRLSKQPVLFVGLGCQISAVKAYFANHPNNDNLYTVDLVCGGVPSSLLISKFRELHPDVEKITSFRNKRKYELKGVVNGKEVKFPDYNLPLTGFKVGMTYRYSCNNCDFAKIHRKADLTIGDLWGQTLFSSEEYDKGVSLILTHSAKGLELLGLADVSKKQIDWKDFLPYNSRIYNGKRKTGLLRKKLGFFSKKLNLKKFSKVYTFNLKPSDGFWYLYMIYWKKKKNNK